MNHTTWDALLGERVVPIVGTTWAVSVWLYLPTHTHTRIHTYTWTFNSAKGFSIRWLPIDVLFCRRLRFLAELMRQLNVALETSFKCIQVALCMYVCMVDSFDNKRWRYNMQSFQILLYIVVKYAGEI